MNTEQLLRCVNKVVEFKRAKAWRYRNLAPEMNRFLKHSAGPARRNAMIPDVFEQVAGSSLSANCQIESFRAGVLKVKVKPGPYMFELRTKAAEIIGELKEQCPSSNIREIKLVCSK